MQAFALKQFAFSNKKGQQSFATLFHNIIFINLSDNFRNHARTYSTATFADSKT
jgi:hypothetical protein